MNELGFKGCKLGLGKKGDARLGSEIERDVELIRLLRERIGPEPMLMWDRGVNTLTWDAAFAIRLTNALEEHGLTWIEEPFEPEDHRRLPAAEGHAARRSSPPASASGTSRATAASSPRASPT